MRSISICAFEVSKRNDPLQQDGSAKIYIASHYTRSYTEDSQCCDAALGDSDSENSFFDVRSDKEAVAITDVGNRDWRNADEQMVDRHQSMYNYERWLPYS
jgi:hypothetical protein